MKLELIEDAGKVWHRLWSVRLAGASTLVCAVDAGWQAYVNGAPRWQSLLTAAISLCAGASRLVKQPRARSRG